MCPSAAIVLETDNHSLSHRIHVLIIVPLTTGQPFLQSCIKICVHCTFPPARQRKLHFCLNCVYQTADKKSSCKFLHNKLCNAVVPFQIHEQFQDFFSPKHQQISISTYAADRERYKPVYCQSHSKEKITKACYNCQQLYCENCKPEKSKCSSDRIQFSHGQSSCHLLGYVIHNKQVNVYFTETRKSLMQQSPQ